MSPQVFHIFSFRGCFSCSLHSWREKAGVEVSARTLPSPCAAVASRRHAPDFSTPRKSSQPPAASFPPHFGPGGGISLPRVCDRRCLCGSVAQLGWRGSWGWDRLLRACQSSGVVLTFPRPSEAPIWGRLSVGSSRGAEPIWGRRWRRRYVSSSIPVV